MYPCMPNCLSRYGCVLLGAFKSKLDLFCITIINVHLVALTSMIRVLYECVLYRDTVYKNIH